MRIGVLSDTHFTSLARGLDFLEALDRQHFRDTDMILHAGDLIDPDILTVFTGRLVYAVRGNLDPPHPHLPQRQVVTAGLTRIGLIHGWGAPSGIEERIAREFQEENLDSLVYGHTHHPACHRRGRTLFFNPGSATDRRDAKFHSIGLLEINGSKINGTILNVDNLLRERVAR